jgi:hypothetical protein
VNSLVDSRGDGGQFARATHVVETHGMSGIFFLVPVFFCLELNFGWVGEGCEEPLVIHGPQFSMLWVNFFRSNSIYPRVQLEIMVKF